MPTEVIFTGSRGRLATILNSALATQEYRIYNFSRNAGDGHLALADLLTGGLLERVSALVHLAWSTVPYTSELHPGLEWETDLPFLTRLLNALTAPQMGGNAPHFIFFSSGGTVYGNAPDRPSREDDPPAPIGWHGAAKVAAERLIEEYGRRRGLRYTIFRLSNPYGYASSGYRPQGIIPLLIDAHRRGAAFSIWGDGQARKDFLFHEDMASAVRLVLDRKPQGVYNLASGESHSIREIIARVEARMGRSVPLSYLPAYPWDVARSELDTLRLQAALGWQPLVSFTEGLDRTIRDLTT